MFRTDESDLDSADSQPPSTGGLACGSVAVAPWRQIFETFGLARYALQDQFHDITKEVSASPAW